MMYPLANRIKAFFLLLVFSLNTVAGFACSVGLDMVYNHHHHDKATHNHKPGEGSDKTNVEEHRSGHSKTTYGHNVSDSKKDCCSNDVTKFALLDKSVVNNHQQLQVPVFILPFTASPAFQTQNDLGLTVNSRFQFVRRSSFLNDTDIQMAIRRFQI